MESAMVSSGVPAATATESVELDSHSNTARILPSGRSVVVKVAGECEELEIRDSEGRVELSVTLTADGPVVKVRGGRLELDAADTVALRCRRFELQTSEITDLSSSGAVRITGEELRVRTEGDIHLNGQIIRLNC
jgi:hypothetical protein